MKENTSFLKGRVEREVPEISTTLFKKEKPKWICIQVKKKEAETTTMDIIFHAWWHTTMAKLKFS